MLFNDTQIAHIFNFHPYCHETVILSNFYKIHDEKYSFLLFGTKELNISYENSIFQSMFILPKY